MHSFIIELLIDKKSLSAVLDLTKKTIKVFSENEYIGIPWILSSGLWMDSGIWKDGSPWNDDIIT